MQATQEEFQEGTQQTKISLVEQLKEFYRNTEKLFEVKTERFALDIKHEIIKYAVSISLVIIGAIFMLLSAVATVFVLINNPDTISMNQYWQILAMFMTLGISAGLTAWMILHRKAPLIVLGDSSSLRSTESHLEDRLTHQIEECFTTIKQEGKPLVVKQILSFLPSFGMTGLSGLLALRHVIATKQSSLVAAAITSSSLKSRIFSGLASTLNTKGVGIALAIVPLIVAEVIKENTPRTKQTQLRAVIGKLKSA